MTYGSKRTTRWPDVPTVRESGFDFFTDSPWGIAGPKGMDPAIVNKLHDAFLLGMSDPGVKTLLDRYNQPLIHMNPEQYTRFAQEAYLQEKATITRLGLAAKT
jgi:tripartite-type tricarboxylate transporter receptor subunit TctC